MKSVVLYGTVQHHRKLDPGLQATQNNDLNGCITVPYVYYSLLATHGLIMMPGQLRNIL